MNNCINSTHLQEWVASGCSAQLITLNVKSLSGNEAYERLLYALDSTARRNDGRLKDKYLKKYKHLDHGGWWCSGIDVLRMEDSEWGCFKPDLPRYNGHDHKLQRYEHPEGTPTEIFALKVPDDLWQAIADNYGIEKRGDEFWQWVVENPDLPILLTEGAKKAGSLLSAGHIAIALPGIWGGYRSDGAAGTLIPQLKIFCQRWREFVFCFDQDKKYKTKQQVIAATLKTGGALLAAGCKVSVVEWEPGLGKGVDDLIVAQGVPYFEGLVERRKSLHDFQEAQKKKTPYLDSGQLLEFLRGEFEDSLSFDEVKSQVYLEGKPFEMNELKSWFVGQFNYNCNKEDLREHLLFIAKQNIFNPIKRYLEACERNSPRISIDNLATRYLGTNEPLYDSFIKKWLIGAVARAFNPGCQMDYALILQGIQGQFKSSFFRVLGGEFFDDSIKDISNDDAELTLNSCWIQELAEFERVTKKKEVEDIKVFVTRRIPRFRKKYDREISEHPRRAVICGTVNKNAFLIDETGNRRFWVIPVSETIRHINIEQLARERDSIWAAAIDAWKAGELPYLSAEDEARSAENNRNFEIRDTWQDEIEHYLENKEVVSIGEILCEVFRIEPAKHDRSSQMRIASILSRMGWKKIGLQRHQNKRQHVWGRTLDSTSVLSHENNFSQTLPKEALTRTDELASDRPFDQPQKRLITSETQSQTGNPKKVDQPDQPFSLYLEKSGFRKLIPPPTDSLDFQMNGGGVKQTNSLKNFSPGDKVRYVGKNSSLERLCQIKPYLQIEEIHEDAAIVVAPGWYVKKLIPITDLQLIASD